MFKTKREARPNLNVNYLCYALRALFWTLIIINWTLIISLIFILVLFDKLQFIEHISIRIQNLWFIFHVSFLCFNSLNINHLEKWNIELRCFILSFMFHFSKHWGSALSLPQCFWIAPTVFWNRSHSVFVFLPLCFWEWNIESKNETSKFNVSAFESIDNQWVET